MSDEINLYIKSDEVMNKLVTNLSSLYSIVSYGYSYPIILIQAELSHPSHLTRNTCHFSRLKERRQTTLLLKSFSTRGRDNLHLPSNLFRRDEINGSTSSVTPTN